MAYDDLGGWDDRLFPPAVEYTRDNVQLAFGARVPLSMFGAHVRRHRSPPVLKARPCLTPVLIALATSASPALTRGGGAQSAGARGSSGGDTRGPRRPP